MPDPNHSHRFLSSEFQRSSTHITRLKHAVDVLYPYHEGEGEAHRIRQRRKGEQEARSEGRGRCYEMSFAVG